jgi:hypothetical protein
MSHKALSMPTAKSPKKAKKRGVEFLREKEK